MANFNTGDIVKLKSGGPLMTVLVFETEWLGAGKGGYQEFAYCQWFDSNGKLQESKFITSALEKAQ